MLTRIVTDPVSRVLRCVQKARGTNGRRSERLDGYMTWTLADGSDAGVPVYRDTVELAARGSFPVIVTALGGEVVVGRAFAD
jgi:hypothetical protein